MVRELAEATGGSTDDIFFHFRPRERVGYRSTNQGQILADQNKKTPRPMIKPWGYTHLPDTTTIPQDLAKQVRVVLGVANHPAADESGCEEKNLLGSNYRVE